MHGTPQKLNPKLTLGYQASWGDATQRPYPIKWWIFAEPSMGGKAL